MKVSAGWRVDQTLLLLKNFRLLSLIIIPTRHSYKPVNSGNKVLYIFYGIGLNFLFNVGFQHFRFVQVSIYKSVEDFVLDLLWVTCHSLLLFFYLHLLFCRHQISNFLNMLLEFQNGLCRTHLQMKTRNCSKILRKENIPRGLAFSIYPVSLLVAIINVMSRHSSRYYFSTLTPPHTFGVLDFSLLYIFELATIIFPIGSLFYYGIILCTYVYCTSQWLNHISTSANGPYIRKVYMRKKSYMTYRGLQIMNSEFNYTFGKAIIQPLLFCVFYASILCSFIVFSFQSNLHILYSVIFVFFPTVSIFGILVMFPMASNINSTSVSFMRSGDGQKISVYNKAFLRSCTPLRVRVGPYFIITKTTTIAGIGFIAYFTLRLVAAQ